MNIMSIIKDAVMYPFTDWKKILILGFIMLFSTVNVFFIFSFQINIVLFLIGLLISFFVLGYVFRIIRSSLDGANELPKFNSWNGMFKDGVKIYIVQLVYLIPIIFITSIFSSSFLGLISNPSPLGPFPFYLEEIIRTLFGETPIASQLWLWVSILIISLYLFLIIPILFMGLVNMVKNNGKLHTAFNFREIFHKITNNGLKPLIIWYLAIVIPFSIIFLIAQNLYIGDIYQSLGHVLLQVIGFSYLAMYLYRLVTLFYKSE